MTPVKGSFEGVMTPKLRTTDLKARAEAQKLLNHLGAENNLSS